MTNPTWFSQPYPPEGASAAEGIRNQLGKPELDYLTILVREAAQNSWDARLSEEIPVEFRMDLRTVGAAEAAAWRGHFLRGAPVDSHLPLRKTLQQPTIRILSISDRGTEGLGGPTRADNVIDDKDRDFVSFLRNIGEPRDKVLGGGTYGFGKAILYLVSKPGVILVHTRCKYQGRFETRLMGAALWQSYQATTSTGTRRYTGRHWWGDNTGEVIEPLIDHSADDMARQLGLQPFGESETGTTISIVDPDLDGLTSAEAGEYLADTVAWQLWPKMLPRQTGKKVIPMAFSVTCDGISYPIPDPITTHPLRLFVAAYQQLSETAGRELRSLRPKRLLGKLGLQKNIRPPFTPTRAAEFAGFEGFVHHVCLMRPAELVVTYWAGPKPPTELISYAGVFRADAAMDEVYAAAEPPTHDSWNYQSLEQQDHRTFVKTTFKRLKESIDEIIGLVGGDRTAVAQVSLGAASDKFSSLVGGSWGIGSATDYGRPGETRSPQKKSEPAAENDAEPSNPSPITDPRLDAAENSDSERGIESGRTATEDTGPAISTPQRPRRPRVQYVGEPYLDEYVGMAVLVQQFRLPVPSLQRVSAELAIALTTDGGREVDPPEGAPQPEMIGWQDEDGTLRSVVSFVVGGGDARMWKALVKPAPDTMTDITIRVEAVHS